MWQSLLKKYRKLSWYTTWRRMGEWRHTFHSLLTLVPDGGVVRFRSKPLYSRGKGLHYPLNRVMCGPWSRSGLLPGILLRLFISRRCKSCLIHQANFLLEQLKWHWGTKNETHKRTNDDNGHDWKTLTGDRAVILLSFMTNGKMHRQQ